MQRLLVLITAAMVLAGCSPDEINALPPPPSVPRTTTTLVVDLSGIDLAAVPGRTTTTIRMEGGTSTIAGGVVGPDGPVSGAVVRAERLVAEGVVTLDLLTAPDGTFTLPGVLGGRYRLRAWRAPELANTTPEVFFLGAGEKATVTLKVERFQGLTLSAAIAPNPPLIDEPASLVVQVAQRSVDEAGIVRATAVPNAEVELFGAGDWRVQTANPTLTDAGGRARWQLTCRRVGNQPLAAVVADTTQFPLNLPSCTVAPPPEADGSAPPSSTSSTARPPGTTTTRPTTTTTRPTTTMTR